MSSVIRLSPLSFVLSPLALGLALLTTASALAQDTAAPSTQTPPSHSSPSIPNAPIQSSQTAAPPPPAQTPAPIPTPRKLIRSAVKRAVSSGFLAQRIDLSDTHHVWHPSRKQLGMLKSAAGYSVDAEKLTTYLTSIAPYVHRAPRKARISLAGSHSSNPLSTPSSSFQVPAKVFPASPGIKLEVGASAAKLSSELKSDPTATHLTMIVQTSSPPSGGPDLTGINARLGHFVTRFNPGERGRTQTVRLAIKLIDGHVVKPGAVFSVNQTVGERTAQRGFGQGIVFVDGKQETQLGGGMCQVATTLFNAALLADLKIVQRYQHVRTIPYAKPGQDATVYWGQKDFKFQNNTQTPLYISYVTTATHAICDLYGKADPSLKVTINDNYKHLGPRHYTAVLKRYVVKNGVKSNDYTAYSAYKWTPSLDYNT